MFFLSSFQIIPFNPPTFSLFLTQSLYIHLISFTYIPPSSYPPPPHSLSLPPSHSPLSFSLSLSLPSLLLPPSLSLSFSLSTAALPEDLVWDYVIQLVSALRLVHGNHLALRCVDPSKVLVTGKDRIKINGAGIMDIVNFDSTATQTQPITMYQV